MEEVKINLIRNIAIKFFTLKQSQKSCKLSEFTDIEFIEEFFTNLVTDDYIANIDCLKLGLYMYALLLKEKFLTEAYEESKNTNTYFKFTINIQWRKNMEFDSIFNTYPEKSGYVDGILWQKKIGVKGKSSYIYKRIDTYNGKYTLRSFKDAEQWERNLILNYEEKFIIIRNILSQISELKKKNNTLKIHLRKIFNE